MPRDADRATAIVVVQRPPLRLPPAATHLFLSAKLPFLLALESTSGSLKTFAPRLAHTLLSHVPPEVVSHGFSQPAGGRTTPPAMLKACLAMISLFRLFNRLRGARTPVLQLDSDVAGDRPVNPFSAGVYVERRQASRRYGDPVQVLVWDVLNAEPTGGWVMDRSETGLGLSLPKPYSEGWILSVRVALAPEEVPTVSVVVKHCHPLAGRWLIGCQFLEPPSKLVLLLLR
jgi:hypothetical protein